LALLLEGDAMNERLTLRVDNPPPAKDGGLSIRNPKHRHHPYVKALRIELAKKMKTRDPFEGAPLKLTMHYKRKDSNSDALNIINGVSDILQKRSYPKYMHDVWVFDDDAQVKRFEYTEEGGSKDEYYITIATI
jgi:hypothetical protein